jgi:RNA polymerase sigma-70 factor (ECF subfamily)
MAGFSTRASLLGRLGNEPESATAWEEFVRIYSPQVLDWCRRHGLQDDDAADICQDVLVRFWKQSATFKYDPNRRFRSYLRRILASSLDRWSAGTRRVKPLGVGDSPSILDSLPARDDLAVCIEAAYDTELMALAMRDVQRRVSPHTWRAFEMLAIEDRRGKEVAAALGISADLAYAARHNVQKMIRQMVARLDGAEEGGS